MLIIHLDGFSRTYFFTFLLARKKTFLFFWLEPQHCRLRLEAIPNTDLEIIKTFSACTLPPIATKAAAPQRSGTLRQRAVHLLTALRLAAAGAAGGRALGTRPPAGSSSEGSGSRQTAATPLLPGRPTPEHHLRRALRAPPATAANWEED